MIELILMLVIVGAVLWAIQQFPIDPTIQKLIHVVVVVVVVVWLAQWLLGTLGGSGQLLHWPRR